MKILSLALLLLASLAFVLLGCSDNSDSLVTPSGEPKESVTLAKMGDVLHSATGNAHWRVVGSQSRVRCLFTAIQHMDGTFSGELQNNDVGPTFRFHATVYDLEVDGNRAKMCFTFSKGSRWLPGPGQPYVDMSGWIGCMVVVDNGEGKSGTEPDRVSLIFFDPPGTYYPFFTPPLTIDQAFALGIDDYLNYCYVNGGFTYDQFVPTIEYGSVQVR